MDQNFQRTTGDVADGAAKGGGKWAFVDDRRTAAPLMRTACRDTYHHTASEQQVLDHIVAALSSTGVACSHTLIVEYYVSLKTNPFVILTGPAGHGKTEFVQQFAEALVGWNSAQYAIIPGGHWHSGTGEDSYFRSMQARFGSWRFLELLQDAAHPGNLGKAYLACFDSLRPDELEYYFATLLRVSPDGQKRVCLPGFPPDEQPIVPPNLSITATVDLAEWGDTLSHDVLRRAGLIEFRAPPIASAHAPKPQPVSPVGYQRLWLQAAVHNIETARNRLSRILGPDQLGRLRCSPDLARLLWRSGIALTTQMLHEVTTYIANSFDTHGRGLFDPDDAQRNAQIAFDAQVVQRMLWRLRASPDDALRGDLTDYLDRLASVAWRRAVA